MGLSNKERNAMNTYVEDILDIVELDNEERNFNDKLVLEKINIALEKAAKALGPANVIQNPLILGGSDFKKYCGTNVHYLRVLTKLRVIDKEKERTTIQDFINDIIAYLPKHFTYKVYNNYKEYDGQKYSKRTTELAPIHKKRIERAKNIFFELFQYKHKANNQKNENSFRKLLIKLISCFGKNITEQNSDINFESILQNLITQKDINAFKKEITNLLQEHTIKYKVYCDALKVESLFQPVEERLDLTTDESSSKKSSEEENVDDESEEEPKFQEMKEDDEDSIKIASILELRNYLNSIQDKSLQKTILDLNQTIGLFIHSEITFEKLKTDSLDIIANAKRDKLNFRSLTTLESISEFFRKIFNYIDNISIKSTYTFGAQTFFKRDRYLVEPNLQTVTPNSSELNEKLVEIEGEFNKVCTIFAS